MQASKSVPRTRADILADIRICRVGLARVRGARRTGYREELERYFQELREQAKRDDYYRVRVFGGRTMLGKIRKVTGDFVRLVRVNGDGDEHGSIDELHLILVNRSDLIEPMELDQYYGMIVPAGTSKIHVANHNLDQVR